jgi:hypothetical protein
MPTDGTSTGQGGQASLLSDPRWLAAGAGGLLAACCTLWAFRGLPLGTLAFWLAPLPLFLAGMGFGTMAAFGALAVATLALWLSASSAGLWLFVLGFGVPPLLLVAAAQGSRGLGLPLALLGILPAADIAGAAWWLADTPGGLEGTLRSLTRTALRRFDIAASTGLVADIVRVEAAAVGFWLALAWLGNAWAAGRGLARAGIAPPMPWRTARLPVWYAMLPALAAGLWLAAERFGCGRVVDPARAARAATAARAGRAAWRDAGPWPTPAGARRRLSFPGPDLPAGLPCGGGLRGLRPDNPSFPFQQWWRALRAAPQLER